MDIYNAGKVSITLVLITALIFGVWIYSGWSMVWQRPRRRIIHIARLTGAFVFVIIQIVNPPRAIFGSCGAFIFV